MKGKSCPEHEVDRVAAPHPNHIHANPKIQCPITMENKLEVRTLMDDQDIAFTSMEYENKRTKQ